MVKQDHKAGLFAVLMIFCAILLRVAGKLDLFSVTVGIIRSLIYIALYIGWGISVSRRIFQSQARGYMMAVSWLCVFWFVIRTMKYYFVTDSVFVRYLWYGYYFPMLFIPLFSVFVSMSLGKPEKYRLSGWALLFYLPTVFLLILVLTNDFHQQVFVFPDAGVWSDQDYEYAIGYYFVFGWELICGLVAFGIMLGKCRLAQKKKWLPALLLCVAVLYAAIYAGGAEWMQLIGGDLAAAQCLMFVGILESCIACGLIQTNTGYEELFMVSRLGAQITDRDNTVCLVSSNAEKLPGEQRICARMHPVFAEKTTRIRSKPIRFGYVLWQEDVSELTEAIEQIEENCRNLAESNRIRQENLETKRKILALQEKNRATDLLHEETAGQMELIDRMLGEYETETDGQNCRRLLAGVAVLGAYIKRYGNLLLVSERTQTLSIRDLSRCFEDSFANLELLGVSCLCSLPSDKMLKTKDMLRIYSAFETVLEDCLFELHHVWVHARERQNRILLSIDFVCDVDLSDHKEQADQFLYEDGSSRFTFRLWEGGEEQ